MAWHAKPQGAYSRESIEAEENALEAYYLLSSLGYHLNSVCALLGNQAGESGYNPWRWGSDNILASTSEWIDVREPNPNPPPPYKNHAYGLFQQDPAGKYLHRQYAMSLPTFAPNYSDISGRPHDGDAQIKYLHWICSNPDGGEWYAEAQTYGMSYQDFYTNPRNENVAFLTQTFFRCYERGTWSQSRITEANYWYYFLRDIPPIPPTRKKLPLFFYLRYPF